ncbi:RNA exonuclease 3 [Pseudogymnoascus destructans]|uniref:RNA exonuclease 3 n=1 Tax=Pseudogymnoascus destructans TaxID=655981 RepID=A0A177ADT7_9PEZI|nr:RNA exonuclease 3 [Pseudogymnoascus destructans]OAF60275.1 RNA exonuclease 3 [Pseudogymnoascus destructans]
MFTSKGLFSKIDCPYSDRCLLPKCLFAHHKPPAMKPAENMPAVPSPKLPSEKQAIAVAAEDGQRKRRKIGHGDVVETKSSTAKTEVKLAVKESSSKSSEKRPISPPPPRRTSSLAPGKKPEEMSKTEPKVPVTTKPALKAAPSVPKPTKSEALNPRLLKHSPATHDLRTKLVKLLHDQLVRLNTELAKESPSEKPLILTTQELITMALDIEEQAAKDKPAIHSSIVKNTIVRYKKMPLADWKSARQTSIDAQAAASALTPSTKPPLTALAPKPLATGLPPHLELSLLLKLLTPLTSLSAHGYVNSIPSADSIATAQSGLAAAQGWEVCDRCKSRFQVFAGRRESDGLLTSGGACTYHWGKPFFPSRAATDVKGSKREKRYRCCGQAIGDSAGCTKAATHVFKVTEVKRLAALFNFITTPENDLADDDEPVCIDGEMGHTVHGLELIRLTATSWPTGTPLLDILVRPLGEVLDLNTRWSGVSASQLTNAPSLPSPLDLPSPSDAEKLKGTKRLHVVESPEAARELLLLFLTPRTPVIGHGLENDLNAVRLIHPTVIDTALLFPHQAGLPYRHALRTLVSLHLGRTIQAGGGIVAAPATAAAGSTSTPAEEGAVAPGHDSKEDANAAGDLVRWSVGREWEKMKRVGWTLVDEKLVPPERISEAFLEDQFVKVGEKGKVTDKRRRGEEDVEEEGEVVE